ncbi:MAG TPA: two pore domain potassium channel family protein [Caldithrix abyssi]|uniref:Two pore domain potassium channel family protein n=1 Tax=Caldithrix abyssi TaxID=187145 RepID=A0A7V5PMU9_CALAY|nr:two pore domain potassium channel family protein [Caldithrix abyssi]
MNYLWNCFYFSFSTFTTVGLGDWYPTGNLNRAIVMIEGALGWLSLGLFITTYANVLLR